MLRFIAGRLIVVLSVGLTLSIVTFFLLNYVIDPAQAIAGEDALFEEIEQIREQYGFDRSNKDASIHLHARKLSLVHPVQKEEITFVAPLPDEPLWKACE